MKLMLGSAGILAASLLMPIIFGSSGNPGVPTARDQGTETALSTTQSTAFAARARNGFCMVAVQSNSVRIRYSLSATVTTVSGFALSPGQGLCLPIGGEPVYTGIVSVIAESGTPKLDTFDY